MSSFTEADWRRVAGRRRDWRPVYAPAGPFRFYIGAPDPDRGCWIEVPAGFETDFASLPTWLMVILWLVGLLRSVCDQLAIPAALHDFMREGLEFELIDGDALFLVAMKARRVNPVLREIAFLAVRTNRDRIRHNSIAA